MQHTYLKSHLCRSWFQPTLGLSMGIMLPFNLRLLSSSGPGWYPTQLSPSLATGRQLTGGTQLLCLFLGESFNSPCNLSSWLDALGPRIVSSVCALRRCTCKCGSSTTSFLLHTSSSFSMCSFSSAALLSPCRCMLDTPSEMSERDP